MGNYISHRNLTGKVIFTDGSVQEFDQPVSVAELMLENPQQFVVESKLVMAGKQPIPLPADTELELDKVYFMLPMKRWKTGLTADEACRILTTERSVFESCSSSSRFLPLFARMCMVGAHEGTEPRKESDEPKREAVEIQPEIYDERSEFFSRQFSGKGWKPGLDTIEEDRVKKKVVHWLF